MRKDLHIGYKNCTKFRNSMSNKSLKQFSILKTKQSSEFFKEHFSEKILLKTKQANAA